MKIRLDPAWREALAVAALLFILSWCTAQMGVLFGERFVTAGAGRAEAEALTERSLFRFDSLYYNDIAQNGYSYNGDTYSSPNIVFAPLFPIVTAGLSWLSGLNTIDCGFLVSKIALYLALVFLYMFLKLKVGRRQAILVLLALSTSAGSYALNSYYSESLMLLALSLTLYSYERKWWWIFALSAAALGASRVTVIPVAVLVAVILARDWRRAPLAIVALSGAAAYFSFIAVHFGNPFELFPAIQGASWGLFHPPTSIVSLVTGEYLFDYWNEAFLRGFANPMDIKTLNLVWTSLAAVSVLFAFWRWGVKFWVCAFASYFLFIYALNSSSEYLISAHRFFMPMIPIYLMVICGVGWVGRRAGSKLATTLAGLLLLVNFLFGVAMTGYFNQGVWYYF